MARMIRKNFYLTQEQNTFLKRQKNITVSEHIRRAIDNYVDKLRKTSSTSPSEKDSHD